MARHTDLLQISPIYLKFVEIHTFVNSNFTIECATDFQQTIGISSIILDY